MKSTFNISLLLILIEKSLVVIMMDANSYKVRLSMGHDGTSY
jgi:hypothetical protein